MWVEVGVESRKMGKNESAEYRRCQIESVHVLTLYLNSHFWKSLCAGFEVIKVVAIDLDERNNANSDVRYRILSQDPVLPGGPVFAINPNTGAIRVNAGGLDREVRILKRIVLAFYFNCAKIHNFRYVRCCSHFTNYRSCLLLAVGWCCKGELIHIWESICKMHMIPLMKLQILGFQDKLFNMGGTQKQSLFCRYLDKGHSNEISITFSSLCQAWNRFSVLWSDNDSRVFKLSIWWVTLIVCLPNRNSQSTLWR